MQDNVKVAALMLFFLYSFMRCQPTSEESLQSSLTDPPWVQYEKSFNALDTTRMTESLQALRFNHPEFTALYLGQVLGLPTDEVLLQKDLKAILGDSSYRALYDQVATTFQDDSDIRADLARALTNFSRAFDDGISRPVVYTFISGFQYQCFLFEAGQSDGLGIGLDLFLGNDYPYASVDPGNATFSTYLTRAFNKEHLAKKAIEVLVEDRLAPPDKPDFLSLMIWGGKKLYIMDQLLDFKSDTVVFEYTPDQLAWCRNNEEQMWNFFFEKDLFYSTDFQSFNKLVAPSPYSPGMPKEAPGATANYMGYRIVESFMNRHPKLELKDLLKLSNPQDLLDQSKFKPAR